MTSGATLPDAVAPDPHLARRVLDALPLTIYSVDLDGRITATNDSWAQFAHNNGAAQLAAEGDMVGRSVFEAIADDASRDQIHRAMALLAAGDTPCVRWEFPCSSPEEERIFLMHISALHRADGVVDGFVFSTVDISSSHRSREALIETGIALSHAIDVARVYEEVSRQVRRAVPSTGVVIAVADDDTAAIRIVHRWGYESDASDAAVEARLVPTWLESLAGGRMVLSEGDGPLEITVPLTSAEGVLGAITLSAQSMESTQQLDEAERVLSVIAAQTAVAMERAWLVRRVEHKRRLEAIGEVAAGVAHELRNPLFGISSAAQLLRFRAREDPVVERNVTRILREVDRLNGMVTALLEFGRPALAHLEPGDPEALWDELLEAEQQRVTAAGLTLVRERPAQSVRCLIDLGQLRQVYLNILVNAVDAAPEGSELVLSSTLLPNGSWRCRLSNGGPAIPAEVLPHVFEFFYSTKPGGSGIGLALCQRIVDEHGGSINIESQPELGTTVTLGLPPTAAT